MRRQCSLLLIICVFNPALQASAAVIADASSDFAPNVFNPNLTNSNGVWSYGYTNSLGGTFIPFNEYTTQPTYFGWRTNLNSDVPVFGKFTTAGLGLNVGDTFLHGGPNGEYAVLRFTALVAGVYDVSAPWKPGDTSDADLYILLNGNGGSPLASTASTNSPGSLQVSSLSLSVNDTLDLSLGTLGSFYNDATGANLVLSSVPEPCIAALVAIAAGCSCGLANRRIRRTR